MLNRRTALFTVSAFLAAPAIARAATLMAISAPRPILWSDGVHDDAPALNALYRGERVQIRRTGRLVGTMGRDGQHRDPVGHYYVDGAVYLPTTRAFEFYVWLTGLRGQNPVVVF